MKPTAYLSVFLLTGALTAAAQNDPSRGVGRELRLLPRSTASFSGSLGVSFLQSDGISGGSGTAWGGTLAGALVKDRVWFFAAAEQRDSNLQSTYGYGQTGVDGRLMANLSDRQNLTAAYSDGDRTGSDPLNAWIPSSFLSMRYTGIISDRMFVSASYSRSSSTRNDDRRVAPQSE